jgi:AcrR family transcriptional regulator
MTENAPSPADDQELGPKERIFHTAVRLFSRKGFNGTGMRELASEAEVNLAMINYFYGSKHGLLEAIVDDFFQGLLQVMHENLFGDDPPEVRLERHIKAAGRYLCSKAQQAIFIASHLPLDDPKTTAFKADRVRILLKTLSEAVLGDLEEKLGQRFPVIILGPAMIAAMMSHFMAKPVIEQLGIAEFDEEFYSKYPEIIAEVALYGALNYGKKRDAEEC